jgi:hypothetical protein
MVRLGLIFGLIAKGPDRGTHLDVKSPSRTVGEFAAKRASQRSGISAQKFKMLAPGNHPFSEVGVTLALSRQEY